MKAITGELPADDEPGWAFEVKWDGMRVLAAVDRGTLHLSSSRGSNATVSFPDLAPLATELADHRALLDGEVVAFDDEGRPDFGRLQHRMHVSGAAAARERSTLVPVRYVAFDLLHLDGTDTTVLAYRDRRRLLTSLLEPGPASRSKGRSGPASRSKGRSGPASRSSPAWDVPAHREGDGTALLAAATQRGLEGVMAKRADSRYELGRRSPAWRKVKVRRRQEVVIGGWTTGSGERQTNFGALMVGYREPSWDGTGRLELRYAGRVGTGFDQSGLTSLQDHMTRLASGTSPFSAPLPAPLRATAHWVEPALVAEVAFGEWTSDGILRHPSYLGLRADKDPADVVREPA